MGVSGWWVLPAVTVPLVLAREVLTARRKKGPRQWEDAAVWQPADPFTCARVCSSKRLLQRLGPFALDPTPDSCLTVCGTSEGDACTEACRNSVCLYEHEVPAWNATCLERCTEECLAKRTY